MNIIDFTMAIPLAIAIVAIFSGILMVITYIISEAIGNRDIIRDLVYNLNEHYILWLGGSFGISYLLVIYLLYKTFIFKY